MNLQKLKKQTHGVSVIIGALMLTLIVVGAAASFAIFTGQKQAELQQAQLERQRREQEEIGILGIETIEYNNDFLENISFSIGSLHTLDSMIRDLRLDGKSVNLFKIIRQNGTEEWWFSSPELTNFIYYSPYKIISPIKGEILNIESNEEWKYNRGEQIGIRDLRSGISPSPDNPGDANEDLGDQIGLYSLNGGNPFVFIDSNYNWKFDNGETVISGIGNETIGADGGLWAYDELGQAYIFKDTKRDLIDYAYYYSAGEEVISLDADGDSIDAIKGKDKGYFWAVNDTGQCYLVHDTDNNDSIFKGDYNFVLYPNERINSLIIDSNPTSIDLDIDKYDNIKITIDNSFPVSTIEKNIHPIQFDILTNYVNTFSHVFQIPTANIRIELNENELILDGSNSIINEIDNDIISYKWDVTHEITPFIPYVFQNHNDNDNLYDSSDRILYDNIIGSVANPLFNQPGGIFAYDLESNEGYIFIDDDSNWKYSKNELILDGKFGDTIIASPNINDQAGLAALDGGEPFIFNDTNGDLIYDSTDMDYVIESDPDRNGIDVLSPTNGLDGYFFSLDDSFNPSEPFAFLDDGDRIYNSATDIITIQDPDGNSNLVTTPSDGLAGGIYGIDTPKAFVFDDANQNFEYDESEIILNNSINGYASPFQSNNGGFYAFDTQSNPEPFIFKDLNLNWLYDAENVLFKHSSAIPENIAGGLFGKDSQATPEPFIFNDINNNWQYDAGEEINLDPDIDAIDAIPSIGDVGGYYTFDLQTTPEPYVFEDKNNNWEYDIETIIHNDPDGDTNLASAQDKDKGGLISIDSSLEPYVFGDENNNWEYDIETIIHNNPDGDGTLASPNTGHYGGLHAIDVSGNPYTFRDFNNDGLYNEGELLSLDPNEDLIAASPTIGEYGGLYGYDGIQHEPFIFIDVDKDGFYDYGEIMTIDADNDGSPANPLPTHKGGLYARDVNGEPYIFIDINQDWEFYKEEIRDDDPDGDGTLASPNTGDQAGLFAEDGSNNEYIFKDANNNWEYDNGEQVISDDPFSNGISSYSDGDKGGLYAFDSIGEPYTFQDHDSDMSFDMESIIDDDPDEDTNLASAQDKDKGGLFALDSNNYWFIFSDENVNWYYDKETIVHNDPDGDAIIAIAEDGNQGGLYSTFNTTISEPLNNKNGEIKSVILEKPSWAETKTIISLTVTDKFGMIGTDIYSLILPPEKQ